MGTYQQEYVLVMGTYLQEYVPVTALRTVEVSRPAHRRTISLLSEYDWPAHRRTIGLLSAYDAYNRL